MRANLVLLSDEALGIGILLALTPTLYASTKYVKKGRSFLVLNRILSMTGGITT